MQVFPVAGCKLLMDRWTHLHVVSAFQKGEEINACSMILVKGLFSPNDHVEIETNQFNKRNPSFSQAVPDLQWGHEEQADLCLCFLPQLLAESFLKCASMFLAECERDKVQPVKNHNLIWLPILPFVKVAEPRNFFNLLFKVIICQRKIVSKTTLKTKGGKFRRPSTF